MNIFELIKNEVFATRVRNFSLWVGIAHAITLNVFAGIVFVSPSAVSDSFVDGLVLVTLGVFMWQLAAREVRS